MAGREHLERELREDDCDRETRGAEDRPAHLEDEHEGNGNEDARLVCRDARRIDACEPGDEREPGMPERERVAGMQPAVRELPDVVQRERVKRAELPHAAEVEEDVAGEGALHEPDTDAQADSSQSEQAAHEPRSAREAHAFRLPAHERAHRRGDGAQTE